MVEDYLSDREQEEALRSWWRDNWRWIVGGVLLGVALLVGWSYYKGHRERQAAQAATAYENVQSALAKPDLEQAKTALAALESDHGSSGYTQQARLMLAKAYVDQGKYDEAVAQYRSALKDSDDEVLAHIVR